MFLVTEDVRDGNGLYLTGLQETQGKETLKEKICAQ